MSQLILGPELVRDSHRLSEEAASMGNMLLLQAFNNQQQGDSGVEEPIVFTREEVISIGVVLHQLAQIVRNRRIPS